MFLLLVDIWSVYQLPLDLIIIEIENLIKSERVELSMAGLEIKPRTPAILDRCAIQTDNLKSTPASLVKKK